MIETFGDDKIRDSLNMGGHLDLEKARQKLNSARDEILRIEKTGDDAAKTVELDQSAVGRLSRMGAMQSQAMSIEAKNRRRAQLQRIEDALEKIEKGDYGTCVTCQKDINPQRLEFDPTSLTCVNCANRG